MLMNYPLHLMNSLGLEITGPNKFKRQIGQLISDELHLFEVNEKFETIVESEGLRELSKEIENDLSTDQKYLYKIVKTIKNWEYRYVCIKGDNWTIVSFPLVDYSKWNL